MGRIDGRTDECRERWVEPNQKQGQRKSSTSHAVYLMHLI